jgi:predicted house-cleaning noncanonical NTP pyrophosphatase (MazG superfamily)
VFEKLEQITKEFGRKEQIKLKLPEECRELIEVCEAEELDIERLVDELSDVLNVSVGIIEAENLWKRIIERMEFKQDRTLERLANGYYDK